MLISFRKAALHLAMLVGVAISALLVGLLPVTAASANEPDPAGPDVGVSTDADTEVAVTDSQPPSSPATSQPPSSPATPPSPPSVAIGVVPGAPVADIAEGEQTPLSLRLTCGPQADCVDAAAKVTIPWPLQPVLPEFPVQGLEYSFDPGLSQLNVRVLEPTTTGGSGLNANQWWDFDVTLTLPPDSGSSDGQQVALALTAVATGAPLGTPVEVYPTLRVPPKPVPTEPAPAPELTPPPGSLDVVPEVPQDAPVTEDPPQEAQEGSSDPATGEEDASAGEAAPETDARSPPEANEDLEAEIAATDESASVISPLADAEVRVEKRASATSIGPGQEIQYTIIGTCSSLTTPCLDFTLSDTLPAELDVTSLPQSNNQRDVTYDSATRRLTIVYKLPVTGGTGLPAGSSQSVPIGMRLPSQTPVTNGQAILNKAEVTAVGANPQEAEVVIEALVPVDPEPVATKSWSPDTAIAQSGSTSDLVLGIRNASSSSTDVRELVVTDQTPATFNTFDVQTVGPVTAFPPGTDRVIVDLCFKPVGSPCVGSEWVSSAEQAGPNLTPPAGNIADATGVRYRFRSSTGAAIPFSPDSGSVATTVKLRDTDRTSGAKIEPVQKLTVSNCASPSLVQGDSTEATGSEACSPFSVLPNGVVVTGSKTIFPDNKGTFGRNGSVVVGQDSGVSMKITVRNASQVPVGTLSVIEPAPGSGAEFDKIDLTKGRVTWPTGATEATMTVTCRSGANPAPVSITKTSGRQALPAFGCETGVAPASVRVDFASPNGGVPPSIPVRAEGSVELHGNAVGVDAGDVGDGLRNCADLKAGIPGGASEGAAQPCGSTPVANPQPGIGGTVKNNFGVGTIVPGQPNPMTIRFKNTGNIPVSNVVIEDPLEGSISDASNPFRYVYLDSIQLPAQPAATLQLWDPQRVGGAGYVDVVPGSGDFETIKKRALGLRILVTGNLDPGASYQARLELMLRDSTTDPAGPPPDGTTWRNCAYFGIGQVDSGNRRCSGNVNVVLDGGYAFNLTKRITPGTVIRPMPGVPPQKVNANHAIRNTGQFDLKELQVVDKDPGFFSAVTFAGDGNRANRVQVNFPVGADSARVDVCTSAADCAGDVWINGTAQRNTSPTIPNGVTPSSVKGLRVTFTNSRGAPLLPSSTQPTSSRCPDANVCFTGLVREFLDGTTTPVPDTVTDISNGYATKPDLDPLQPTQGQASFGVVEGSPQLNFKKGPNSRIGPGESAPFTLEATNSGTGPVNNATIVDPLPKDLTFDPVVAGAPPGQPYAVEYSLPTGYPTPTVINFTEIKAGQPGAPANCTDPNRVCALKWEFPGYVLPPGGAIKVTFNVQLTPGVLAGQTIVNTAGVAGSTGSGTNNVPCRAASVVDNPDYGPGTFCTDPGEIATVAGDDFQAQKWIKADPSLGFINGAGQYVSVNDPGCPSYSFGGAIYTRYPCVARVAPGGTIDYLIRGVNSGTNPAKQIIVVDGLPVVGDNGVILTGQARGTEWNNRPLMATPVQNAEGYSGVVTGYTDAAYTSPAFCRAALRPPNSGDTCPPGSFSAPFGPAVTGFQTTLSFPDSDLLNPGESFTLTWSMKAPLELNTTLSEPVAWNSFGLRPTFKTVGGSLNTLPAVEPLKVGVAMPQQTFQVVKSVVGLPPGVTLAPFPMEYTCAVQGTEVARGLFTLRDGETWTSDKLPYGAECRVWESDAQGGASSNLGPNNAAVVVLDAGNTTPVRITNTYDTGELVIAKSVIWDDVPPVTLGDFDFQVSCTFPTTANLLPGYPRSFKIADGQSETLTDLPVGASCDVTETNTQGATITVMVPSNASAVAGTSATVLVDSGSGDSTRLDVQNIYETGGIQLVKDLSGTATQWAQGPYIFDVACRAPSLPDLDYQVTLLPRQLTTTISPIPVGYVCTITESDRGDALQSTVNPSQVTIPPYPPLDPPPGPVVVSISNEYKGAWVEITKKVSGDAAAKMAGAVFDIQVRCERDVPGGTQTFIDETLQLADGQTGAVGRLDNPAGPDPFVGELPLDSRCWATESNSGATNVINPHPEALKLTLDQPTQFGWEVENVFTSGGNAKGSIQVSKTVTGGAAQYARPFVFEADCTVGNFTLPTQSLTIDPTGPLVGYFTSLPVGAVCDVSETDNGGANSTVPIDLGTVTVPAQGSPAVTVSSTNNFPAGSVTIGKVTDGDAAAVMSGAEYLIEVTCERSLPGGGEQVILTSQQTLRNGESVKLPDPLPIGARCWAEELNSVGATQVVIDHDVNNKVTVTADQLDIAITVTNVYTPGGDANGSIRISKTLTGAAAAYAQGPFVFETSCTLAGFTLPVQTTTLTPNALVGYVTNLPVGAVCDVVEVDQGSATGVVPRSLGQVTVPANGVPAVGVAGSNDFPAGSVSVSKKVTGSASGPMAGAEFTIQVTCERDIVGSPTPEVILDQSVKITADSTVLVSDTLPIGARCWAAETDSVGAARVTISNDETNKAVVSVATPDLDITVTNDYPPGGARGDIRKSGIEITKTLTGSAATYAKGPFEFVTNCSVGNFNLKPYRTVLDVGALVGYVNPIPVGAECTVVETAAGSSATVVPVTVATVTVPAEDRPAVQVTAANDFPGRELTVTKKVVGDGSGKGPFAFQVTCEGIDVSEGGASAPALTFTLRADESRSLTVPVGATCAVVETSNGGATSVLAQLTPAGGSADAIAMAEDRTVEFTNTFPTSSGGKTTGGGTTAPQPPAKQPPATESNNSLAVTGANLTELLRWGLLLLLVGAGLYLASRWRARNN